MEEILSQPAESMDLRDLRRVDFREVCVEDSCPEFEADTSNGRLSKKNLESHLIECENDLETLSFKLSPNTSFVERTKNLSDFLAFVHGKVDSLNAFFEAQSIPLIPFSTIDEKNGTWYHLHRNLKSPKNIKNTVSCYYLAYYCKIHYKIVFSLLKSGL